MPRPERKERGGKRDAPPRLALHDYFLERAEKRGERRSRSSAEEKRREGRKKRGKKEEISSSAKQSPRALDDLTMRKASSGKKKGRKS